MTPVEITSVLGVLATVVASLVVPWILRRRRKAEISTATEVASWQGITKVLQAERDALRIDRDSIEREYKAKLRALDDDYQRQVSVCRQRITQLEAEVAGLYVRLYQPPHQ